MTEMDVELLCFYRQRLSESWRTIEAMVPHLPERFRGAVSDHLSKARAVTAKAERLREESMVPGLDDLADYTGELGNE